MTSPLLPQDEPRPAKAPGASSPRRIPIQELLDGVTEEGMAALNQATAWVQDDPAVGRER